jgi:DNA polymerase V
MENFDVKLRFSNVIKIIAKNKSEFARMLGVTPQYLRKYETGEKNIGIKTREKFLDIGINPEYLSGKSLYMFADNEAGLKLKKLYGDDMSNMQKTGVRFIATLDTEEDIKIPLMLSPARAGEMSWTGSDVESYVSVKKYHHAGSFYAVVHGDSMIGAGIEEDMRILVDTTLSPVNGDIVLAQRLDTQAYTVKRLKKNGKEFLLHPDNPDYEPIVIDENIIIRGVVTKAERVFR